MGVLGGTCDQLTRQISKDNHQDRFLLSAQMRYAKKLWTIKATTDSMTGPSKEEKEGETR